MSMNFSEDDEPPFRPVRRRIMQIVVSLAIAALVLPGFIVTWSTQVRTANFACQIAVDYYAPGASAAKASFSVLNLAIPGWNCYAVMFDGSEAFVAHLGVIPGAPRLVPQSGS
jgi:hypothetical protein